MRHAHAIVPLLALLASCGGSGSQHDSSVVPADVPLLVRQQYVAYSVNPAGYNFAVPWITAIHDERSTESSTVEVEHLRLYCQTSSGLIVTSQYNYDDGRFEGGLWQRRPRWFESGFVRTLTPRFSTPPGTVSFSPSDTPTAAWHPYGPRFENASDTTRVPNSASRCWTEAVVKITGRALVQAGLDYWETAGGDRKIEGAVSDWYFAAQGWQTIRVPPP